MRSDPAASLGWRLVAGVCLALSLATASEAAAETFNARGNEPGWHIEITDAGLTFRAMDGEMFTIAPTPQAETANGIETRLAVVDGRPFSLSVANEVCVDTMSGMPYPKTVVVALGERKLSGCGGDPASLLRGEWLVEEIGGMTVVGGSRPTVSFEPDGQANGNGSCNRFFGRYALTGEGLTISGLGLSRMACEQPLMEQENIFVQALGAVRRFDIDSEQRLVLHSGDGRTIVARRA